MASVSVKKCTMITAAITLLLSSPVGITGIMDGAPGVRVAHAETVDSFMSRNDPGVQLNQAREYLERQATERKLEEGQEGRKAQVETNMQKPEESAAAVTFTLNSVQVDPSVVLTEEEIQSVTAPYIGKPVSLSDLYAITGAINKLYADKGYLVCRAYLPPQRIHAGAVQIKLVEGKTGNVKITGLRKTREGYVKSRIPLKPETVANTADLNKQLQWFNGTNDVQLRVTVHAGEQPGTTDYEIVAYEPQPNQTFTLYMDNNGYDTSGRFRQGLFYNIRSLTGIRDSLRLSYLRSRGTDLFSGGYSVPVGKMGTRLDLDYSTNKTEIVKGQLKDQNIKGKAHMLGVTLRHPLRVDQKRRDEVGLQYLYHKSKTDWGPQPWADDKRNIFIPYISFTHYGDSSIFYHKHSFPITDYHGEPFGGLYPKDSHYLSYQMNMLYQKRYKHGQMLSGQLNAQFASNSKDMSSADRFYVGGSNNVRGYEENYIGGNSGFSASLTYQAPINKAKTLHAFTFFDYGWVKTPDADGSSYSLYSTGLGLSASYRNFYSSLTLGIPLKRHFDNYEEPNRGRVDFTCSYTF